GLVQKSRNNFRISASKGPASALVANLRPRPLAELRRGKGRIQRGCGRSFGRTRARMVLVALLLCGCVPTTTDTVPLQQAVLAPPQTDSISSDGYRLEALPMKYPPDLLVLVAMSGG